MSIVDAIADVMNAVVGVTIKLFTPRRSQERRDREEREERSQRFRQYAAHFDVLTNHLRIFNELERSRNRRRQSGPRDDEEGETR